MTTQQSNATQPSSLMMTLYWSFALFLGISLFAGSWMVIDSAFQASVLFVPIAVVVVGLGWFVVTRVDYVREGNIIQVKFGDQLHRSSVRGFAIVSMVLSTFAFTQTLLWVINHDNSIHEPRSILLLAIAGTMQFWRAEAERVERQSSGAVK